MFYKLLYYVQIAPLVSLTNTPFVLTNTLLLSRHFQMTPGDSRPISNISIIDFFTSPADETTVSVGLGINSLWIWMIPVTFGWVKVGTQTSALSIKAALKSVPVP